MSGGKLAWPTQTHTLTLPFCITHTLRPHHLRLVCKELWLVSSFTSAGVSPVALSTIMGHATFTNGLVAGLQVRVSLASCGWWVVIDIRRTCAGNCGRGGGQADAEAFQVRYAGQVGPLLSVTRSSSCSALPRAASKEACVCSSSSLQEASALPALPACPSVTSSPPSCSARSPSHPLSQPFSLTNVPCERESAGKQRRA